MRSGVPWHIKVHPDVRENARDAAGVAPAYVGRQWLNTVIADSTADEADEDDYYDDPYAPPVLRRRLPGIAGRISGRRCSRIRASSI